MKKIAEIKSQADRVDQMTAEQVIAKWIGLVRGRIYGLMKFKGYYTYHDDDGTKVFIEAVGNFDLTPNEAAHA